MRHALWISFALVGCVASEGQDGSNDSDMTMNDPGDGSTDDGSTDGDSDSTGDGDSGGGDDVVTPPPAPATFSVALVADGATGVTRVSFGVPLADSEIADASQLRVLAGSSELPTARKTIAAYANGSPRSVLLQVDVNPAAVSALTIEVGVAGNSDLAIVPVANTLAGSASDTHPRVWAVLPADVLAASGVVGPVVPHATYAGSALDAWGEVCDYDRWDTDKFLAAASSRDVWLFDRTTAMYRGYAITGDLGPLRSAYREASLYRAGMTIANGVATSIPVPTASSDLKYYYSQGMALHYLLTGDERFREAAEAVSARVASMWDPSYDGSDKFWTERHAGFALLAHEWAALVTDDKLAAISARADLAVTEYLEAQAANRFGQTDPNARCFAHTASAHGEDYGTAGCSPWMSAILADGLDAHARRVGGTRATDVRAALGRLARSLARNGRDASGRPLYWMGVGNSSDERDDYDEHWGESAYVIALGWASTGRNDTELRTAADELVAGLAARGVAGQLRSFNWQCRSAVMTPALLQ